MGIWNIKDRERMQRIPSERIRDIKTVLSAYKSVLSPFIYVSIPITSGILLYEVLDKYAVRSIQELSQKGSHILFQEVVSLNKEKGVAFAKKIASQTNLAVVAPVLFETKEQKWSQDDYMYMWLHLIEDKIKEIHLIDGWQYSNGSVEEFVRGIEMQFNFCDRRDVHLFDYEGRELGINEGVLLIAAAIEDLASRGYNPITIFTSLHKLISVAGFYMDPLTSRREWLGSMEFFRSKGNGTETVHPFCWRTITQSFERARAATEKFK